MVHIQIQYIDTPFATTPKLLIATYVGPAFTNVPMTATGTSTVVLGDTAYTHDANGNLTSDAIHYKNNKNGTGFSDEMWVGKDKYVYGIKKDGTLVPKGSGNLSN